MIFIELVYYTTSETYLKEIEGCDQLWKTSFMSYEFRYALHIYEYCTTWCRKVCLTVGIQTLFAHPSVCYRLKLLLSVIQCEFKEKTLAVRIENGLKQLADTESLYSCIAQVLMV